MKRFFTNLMLLAVAATATISCENGINDEPIGGVGGNATLAEVTLAAGKPAGVRTEMVGLNPYWSVDDQIGVYTTQEDEAGNYALTNDATERTTTTTFTGTTALADRLYVYYPYSTKGIAEKGAKVDIPAMQNPTATSFDGAADIMIAKPVQLDAEGKQLSELKFARLGAIAKIVLKDETSTLAGQHISSLTMTAESNLTGCVYLDVKSQQLGELHEGQSKSVNATYTADTQFEVDGTNAAYVIVYPQTLASGQTLTIEAVTENHFISKPITLQKDVVFESGKITTLNIPIKAEHCGELYFSGGKGTEESPYRIASVEDLQTLSTYVANSLNDESFAPFKTAHYIQVADIDFENGTHSSIGNTNAAAPYSFFCGKYDGNGFKIENVKIANANSNKAHGFFGYLDGEAYIKNMTFNNVTIESPTWNVGVIVGCVQSTSTATIEGCVVTNGNITGKDSGNGGIVGKLMAGNIIDCSYQGNVTALTSAKHQIGGIVGEVSSGGSTIEGCTFDGAVKGACGNVGGIAGLLNGGSFIKECTVTAASTIEGGTIANNGINVGGIAGYVNNSKTGGRILNCECKGTITSHYYDAGGVAGHNRGLAIIGCTFSGTLNCDYDDSGESYASNGAGSTKYSRIGGVCGDQRGNGNIDNCTVTGTVNGKKWTGGVVGLVEAGGVNNCTVSGKVTGTAYVAGVAGYISTGSVKSCSVQNATINGTANVGGVVGSTTAPGYITSCSVSGSTVKSTGDCAGGIAGQFNQGGLVSQCNVTNTNIETNATYAGGIVGYIQKGSAAKTTRVESSNVDGGSVKSTANGRVGGIFGGCDSYGIINKCSAKCNVSNTGTKNGNVGGIGGWVSSDNCLVINCVYWGGEVTNDNNGNGGVAGIVGAFAATNLANTAIVNCVAFPTKVSTGPSNANIAGIAGYANTIIINNCYCPTPDSSFFFNGEASGASRGSIYGWLRGNNNATGIVGTIVNAYWLSGFKAGNSSGAYTYTKKEQALTDAQMRNNGAVSMPSTGTSYPCFIDALNAGADEYNKAMIFDTRAEEWVMGTNGYPVIFGSPLASSTATSTKTRVSLIGDSITTYEGYTLSPKNFQYPKSSYTDFTSVTQTYWYQLIYDKMTNAVLEANSSHTATCVQNTVSSGYPGYGFLNRYADLGNPDVIFINGGTNDSWSYKLPVGTLDFTIKTEDLDTYQFAQAYDKLIRLMQAKYPNTKIFCIIGDNVMDSQYTAYAQVIRDVCNHYNIHYAEVVFADRAASTYDDVHPNVAGMKEMADQIWEQVKSYI